ncbi:hypothetical protein TcYC6_0050490 [Trypanosoma cruzi]|nr:hypothetical protein TcYC6_0050490 [Trypanosoma cruzi]
MAEPGRTLRLLLLGPAPGPDGIHGEALRHLGRVARRAVPWLFDSRPCAGTVPRNRRRVVVLRLPNPERTASNRDSHRPVTLSSCLSKLMERTPAARIRNVIESQSTPAAILLFAGQFHPRPIAAPQRCHAPQHRTAAVFVDHADAFGTVGPDAVILEMRRHVDSQSHRTLVSSVSSITQALWFASTNSHPPPGPSHEAHRREQRRHPSFSSSSCSPVVLFLRTCPTSPRIHC